MNTLNYLYQSPIRKPEGKTPLDGPRHSWEDSNKLNYKEIGWESVGWIHLAQDRAQCCALVNTVIDHQVQWIPGNFLSS